MIIIVEYRHIGMDATPQWGKTCLTSPLTHLSWIIVMTPKNDDGQSNSCIRCVMVYK